MTLQKLHAIHGLARLQGVDGPIQRHGRCFFRGNRFRGARGRGTHWSRTTMSEPEAVYGTLAYASGSDQIRQISMTSLYARTWRCARLPYCQCRVALMVLRHGATMR